MKSTRDRKLSGLSILAILLVLCVVASMVVLCSRMVIYSSAAFENVMPLYEAESKSGVAYAPVLRYPAADEVSDDTAAGDPADSVPEASLPEAETPAAEETKAPGAETVAGAYAGSTARPEFRMEAEVEIFKFSYDETGKITVIGPEGNTDKLIAPGTANKYQFTLQNPGNVTLDYIMTMEAYIEGTDLYLPVNARVWDYTNRYLVGSPEEMPHVLELNTVEERAKLGAGKYATYTLEWEWPFEWGDDEHDTLLGNLAVDGDITLTIIIRTVAEYDDGPGPGITTPNTGDNSQLLLFSVIGGAALVGLLVLSFFVFKSKDKEDKNENNE